MLLKLLYEFLRRLADTPARAAVGSASASVMRNSAATAASHEGLAVKRG
jgi:hypothetical protein